MAVVDGIDIDELPKLAKAGEPQVKKAFERIRKRKPKELDNVVLQLHEEAFERVDCLTCGSCCRSLGPRITERDIERLAKHLRMKTADFVAQYLHIDEDGDYVFQSMPCPFLAADNYCMVYENRPKACREYPHTDRKKFVQLLKLSLANRSTCPVVYKISNTLAERY